MSCWSFACGNTGNKGTGGEGGTTGSGGEGVGATAGAGAESTTTTDSDPCAGVGGCAATQCSMDCTKTCCCQGCDPGDTMCVESDELWQCHGSQNCWDRVECNDGCWFAGSAVGSMCLESMSCAEIASAYEYAVSRDGCYPATECVVLNGHCSDGLPGCYHPVNNEWTSQEQLDRLAEAWNAASCTGPVCDCPPTPTTAECVDGHCAGI